MPGLVRNHRMPELPVDRATEQIIVDNIARELNDGELQTPYNRLQEVAGVLVVSRHAYRLGRSEIEFEQEEFDDVLTDILHDTCEVLLRSGRSVLSNESMRAHALGAFTTGRMHRDTMVELEQRPEENVFNSKLAMMELEFTLHGSGTVTDKMHRFGD